MKASHFQIEELVDAVTLSQMGEEEAWNLLLPETILMIDGVREFFGVPVTANDYLWGGELQFCGYRPSWYQGGAVGSMHRVGGAVDFDVKGYTALEARRLIMENQNNPLLQYIQRMERGTATWVHADVKKPPAGRERIYLFYP